MDSFKRFAEKQLPPREAFYSRLSNSTPSQEDYDLAVAPSL